MFGSAKHLILASAVVLAGLPASAAEGTPTVAPAPASTAVVKCPGVTSIPFTADEQQALPLRIVGSLACGDTVVILADREGYTARIRTKGGQEGYVARMYLITESDEPAAPAIKPLPSVAAAVNGVARWEAGAPGCTEFISRGRHVESITANGITVQVSLQDSGWKYRANVAISNQGETAVEVVPGIVTLDELIPNLKALLATSPEKVAHAPTHQVLWTSADAVPSPSAAVHPAGAVLNQQADRNSATPDYLNPHVAQASEKHVAFARSESVDLQAIALKPGALPSGQKAAGVMWFERDASAHELSLRVPVGDVVFDFPFTLEQKK